MAKQDKNTISEQTRQEALAVAKATQKPGQTREQTRLIAQGIEKGIAQYKKQQKAKARAADKAKKQKLKQRETTVEEPPELATGQQGNDSLRLLPWILLILSWVTFALYLQSQ